VRIKEFKIDRFYARYEFSTPYMISGSDAETVTIQELLNMDGRGEENLRRMLELKLSYTEAKGDYDLRREISNLYTEISEDGIITFSGAEEGIFCYMSGVLKEGDELIVQYPCYQSLHEVARANGVKIIYWEMREEEGWRPNFHDLEGLITLKTKAILVNTPQNPTGINLFREEQSRMIEICRMNDLYLFSDEVYRLGEHNVGHRLPPAADLYPKAVSLGVLSKSLGLPGLRMGWIATQNLEIMESLEIFKDYTTICGSGPSEFLAKLALDNWEKLIERNNSIIQENLSYLEGFMERYSDLFEWVHPQAGCIAFIRPIFKTTSVKRFCMDLIEKKGLVLLPSTTYLYTDTHFRIGFGKKDFKEGLDQLEQYILDEIVNSRYS